MRCGLIGRKIGMTGIWDSEGHRVPVTVVQVEGCHVVSLRTSEKDGYDAVQVGAGSVKHVTKPMQGHFSRCGVEPKACVREFRVSSHDLKPGDSLTAAHFAEEQWVDVVGTSVGKGFAGSMKRHNFGGLRASHGVSISHRSHGSTGQCQDPGRVFKGKKMAGHMGARRVTAQNLKVVSVDSERGLLFLKGSVPGFESGWVMVSDALKRPRKEAS